MASPWMLMRWAQCMERSPVTGMMAATEHIKETWCLIQMDGTVASCIWEGGWLWCSRVRCIWGDVWKGVGTSCHVILHPSGSYRNALGPPIRLWR